MAKGSENPLLKAALGYYRLGWSIIPIGAEKKPPRGIRWKPYQKTRPDEKQLRKWFGTGKYKSLAVICGDVSGGLCVLDLDSEQRCKWWRDTQTKLAQALPAVSTIKGEHFYFRAEPFRKKNGDEIDLLCDCPSRDKFTEIMEEGTDV